MNPGQRLVLDYVKKFITSVDTSPTAKQICDALDMDRGTVNYYLNWLITHEYLLLAPKSDKYRNKTYTIPKIKCPHCEGEFNR